MSSAPTWYTFLTVTRTPVRITSDNVRVLRTFSFGTRDLWTELYARELSIFITPTALRTVVTHKRLTDFVYFVLHEATT